MSTAIRIGRSMIGPTPSTISTATPIPASGVVISANRMAASTPSRRTGWRVTSAHSAGSLVISGSVVRSRIARYSGSARPAWRMKQIVLPCRRTPAGRPGGSDLSCQERLPGGLEGCLDLGLPVGDGDEPGFELGGRQEGPQIEHRPKEPGVRRTVTRTLRRRRSAASGGRRPSATSRLDSTAIWRLASKPWPRRVDEGAVAPRRVRRPAVIVGLDDVDPTPLPLPLECLADELAWARASRLPRDPMAISWPFTTRRCPARPARLDGQDPDRGARGVRGEVAGQDVGSTYRSHLAHRVPGREGGATAARVQPRVRDPPT